MGAVQSSVIGVSAIAETGLFGLSMAATVVGGALVVAAAAGTYYLYTRCNKDNDGGGGGNNRQNKYESSQYANKTGRQSKKQSQNNAYDTFADKYHKQQNTQQISSKSRNWEKQYVILPTRNNKQQISQERNYQNLNKKSSKQTKESKKINIKIEQIISSVPLSPKQLDPKYSGPSIPEWEPISMTQEQFDQIVALTKQRFDSTVKKYICPHTMQIMRMPCTMNCCKNREKEDKWAEKCLLQQNIKTRKRCLICHSPADYKDIQLDQDLYEKILGFRKRLLKAYKSLDDSQKKQWKIFIDAQFGPGYSEECLQNFKLTQTKKKISQFKFVIKNIEGDIKMLENLEIENLTLQMLILQSPSSIIRKQQVSSIQQMYIDGQKAMFSYQEVKNQKILNILKLSKVKINEVTICKRYVGGIIILIN